MSSERVLIRRGFFMPLFERLQGLLPEIFSEAQFDQDDADCLIQLFFLLSDAYKIHRVEPKHRTNDFKKAGLTIAAIMAMRPVRFIDAANNPRAFYANPIFGLQCAASIMKRPIFRTMPEPERQQLYNWLDECRFPCTQGMIALLAAGSHAETGHILDISTPELATIDIIVQQVAQRHRIDELEQKA